jgi:hypothetical protein
VALTVPGPGAPWGSGRADVRVAKRSASMSEDLS